MVNDYIMTLDSTATERVSVVYLPYRPRAKSPSLYFSHEPVTAPTSRLAKAKDDVFVGRCFFHVKNYSVMTACSYH